MGEVAAIDVARRVVRLRRGDEIGYDWLLVAIGSRHAYFGKPEWETMAPGLKTMQDALSIRERLLIAFERAERATAREDHVPAASDLTFVVVGGGPTGVEMAGAIAEIAQQTMLRNFRHIDPKSTRVYLIEGASEVLPPFPEELRSRAREQLEELGVQVLTHAMVVGVDSEGVDLECRTQAEAGTDPAASVERVRIDSHTVVWAAGNQAPSLLRQLEATYDRSGRVKVAADLSVPGHSEIFVVGDAASFEVEGGASLPGLAPVAVQQGRHAARAIQADLAGVARRDFRYVDRGTMATVGKARAVAWIHRMRFGGLLAWLTWSLVHVLFLIGYRNRVSVLIEWIYMYVTNQRGARLLYGVGIAEVEETGRGSREPALREPASRSRDQADRELDNPRRSVPRGGTGRASIG
jgi:NADH dehydrogenase